MLLVLIALYSVLLSSSLLLLYKYGTLRELVLMGRAVYIRHIGKRKILLLYYVVCRYLSPRSVRGVYNTACAAATLLSYRAVFVQILIYFFLYFFLYTCIHIYYAGTRYYTIYVNITRTYTIT